MKKVFHLFFLLAFAFFSCSKKNDFLKPLPAVHKDTIYSFVKDTTINDIWDGQGQELTFDGFHNYRIHGSGTLRNWIIDAAYDRQIFDTSINLENIKTADNVFSTKWYGISSKNSDNWWIIQKSINICKQSRLICFTPGGGNFKYSKTLDFSSKLSNGEFIQSYNQFEGDASYWDNGQGTTFQYTGKDGPAMSLQLQKGSVFKNFALFGLYKCPGGPDSVYFQLTENNFKDVSGNNLSDNYTGIGIDYYFDGFSISGSTGITIKNVSIGGFAVGLGFSQNGRTLNDEAHTISDIHFFDNKYCIEETNAQEKGTTINNLYSWGSCYNIVNIGLHGSHQAGSYSYDGANIAGRCIEVVHASIGHWFSSHFSNWYCESIGRIINFSGQMPFTFTNCNFDMNLFYNTKRDVIISNSAYLSLHSCVIRYYDGQEHNIYVHGYATIPGYPDNYFGIGNSKLIYH